MVYAYVVWRIAMALISVVSRDWWQLQFRFLGPTPWANFDGAHYLGIATSGYGQYQQAFFPLYPLIISALIRIWPIAPHIVGLAVSHAAFFVGLCMLYTYARKYGDEVSRWTIALLLVYPMSFYFASVYTESLFFMLAAGSLLAMERKQYVISSLFIALAGATRLIGILLLLPLVMRVRNNRNKELLLYVCPISVLGLAGYMGYLWYVTGDPIAFFHVQPFFGANRSGSAIVLLPQVLWRYVKIVVTASPVSLQYWVAAAEVTAFIGVLFLIVMHWKDKTVRPFLVYSATVVLVPSLSGTLSSMPRYILAAFPLFILIAKLHNRWIKYFMVALSVIGLVVCTSLYLSGYFIS